MHNSCTVSVRQVVYTALITGSPSSKYENEGISIKTALKREKTVYSTNYKTAINRPMDHPGET